MTKTHVSYRRTVSKNYQSETHEFGFEVTVAPGDAGAIVRARQLCQAVVNDALGQKIGRTRKQLDLVAQEFFGTTWMELSTGVKPGEEEL